jgi:hypothetical protein
MKKGYSRTAACAAIGIHPDTARVWAQDETKPEFSGAVKMGAAHRAHKLETDLLAAPDGPTVTSRIFALKNACPDEWKDKQETRVTGELSINVIGRANN